MEILKGLVECLKELQAELPKSHRAANGSSPRFWLVHVINMLPALAP